MISMSRPEVPPDLLDEITSLNSIYSSETLTLQQSPDSSIAAGDAVCVLSPPASEINPPVSFAIGFPSDYPAISPRILSGTTFGKGLSKEEVTQLARDVLQNVWTEGGVVMFEFVEGLKELLHREKYPNNADPEIRNFEGPPSPQLRPVAAPEAHPLQTLVSSIPWILTPATTVQKSTFVGRCIRVDSAETAKAYITELVSTDRRVAKATHNITAYRIRTGNGLVYQDNDDDGETAAGSRLGHLLEMIDVWNVLVIVSRWYGGIKLGPDRFRLINQVAREALVIGNFIDEHGSTKHEDAGESGKKKKKGRHH